MTVSKRDWETPDATRMPAQVNANVTVLPKRPAPRKKFLTTRAPASFDKVAAVGAFLGALIGAGAAISLKVPSIGIYAMAIGLFHLLEFVVTAKYNAKNLGMWSFLLTNGVEYASAQFVAVTEYCVRWFYYKAPPTPSKKILGLAVLAVGTGQLFRTTAMIQAAQSFNHYIQEERSEDHKLVRSGVYSIVRHPSYTGYFCWAVGSQVILGNRVSLVLFTLVLGYYFVQRLKVEEAALIKFFGDDYVTYKREVWSGIPLYR